MNNRGSERSKNQSLFEVYIIPLVGHYLSLDSLLYLSITCNTIFTNLSPLITSKYYFQLPEKLRHGKPFSHKFMYPVQNFQISFLPPPCLFLPSLTTLEFTRKFNQPVNTQVLPPSILHIIFGTDFNQPVDNLPPSLLSISFGYNFNQRVDKLPPKLNSLNFGALFAQSINNLPHSLKILSFNPFVDAHSLFDIPFFWKWDPMEVGMDNYCFSHKASFFPSYTPLVEQYTTMNSRRSLYSPNVDNLPPSLTHLLLGDGFDSNLTNLPPSITHLFMQGSFEKQVDFPPSLTHLVCWKVKNSFSPLLPSSIISFVHIDSSFPIKLPLSLPHLQNFYFDYTLHVAPFPHIPTSPCLTHLWLPIRPSSARLPTINTASPSFSQSLSSFALPLPTTITHLHGDFDLDAVGHQVKFLMIPSFNSADDLPVCLTHLDIELAVISDKEGEEREKEKVALPKMLTHLAVGTTGSEALTFVSFDYPPFISDLTFGATFNSPVDNLPDSIVYLTFGFNFNQPINSLPQKLQRLILGERFNHPVDHLPPSLSHLAFHPPPITFVNKWESEYNFSQRASSFNHPIDHLPSTLSHLLLGSDFNHPIDHLPTFLSHLSFGSRFNSRVDHLPPFLSHISLSCDFNRPVDLLPPTITHFHVFSCEVVNIRKAVFNHPLSHPCITHLALLSEYNHKITKELFPSLTHLHIYTSYPFISQLPNDIIVVINEDEDELFGEDQLFDCSDSDKGP